MNSKVAKIFKVLGIGLGTGTLVAGLLFWGYQNSARIRLEKLRTALRADGLPVTVSEMRLTSPPVEENAAPLYLQLHQLLQSRPLVGYDAILEVALSNFYATDWGLVQLRTATRNRQDILQLLHQAVVRPQCVFQRTNDLEVPLGGDTEWRGFVHLLVSESALLVADGKPVDAVHKMETGFHIANHLKAQPTRFGQMVGIVLDSATLQGLKAILYKAGDRPEVANAVADAIARNWRPANVAFGMTREVAMTKEYCNWLRRDPAQLTAMMGGINSNQISAAQQQQVNLYRFYAPLFMATVPDANEYNGLDYQHRAFLIMKRPYLDGKADLVALSKEMDSNSKQMTHMLAVKLLPDPCWVRRRQAEDETNVLTTRSAALVLAYRARHGKFPEQLEEAVSPVPIDPLNGQPLRYRLYNAPNGSKGFEVYSAGDDGKFDGGLPTGKTIEHHATFWYPMIAYEQLFREE